MHTVSWESVCAEIEAEPRLSAEEERALWNAWQDGDERARKKLNSCTLRYALGPAKAAAGDGRRWEPGDLLGEAVKALDGCLNRWDGTGSFAGYASARLRGAIKDFLRRRADVMRAPAGSERVLSLDAPTGDDGATLLDQGPEHFDNEALDLPRFTKREAEVMSLTLLAVPPGSPEVAAASLGLPVESVLKLLRSALRRRAAA